MDKDVGLNWYGMDGLGRKKSGGDGEELSKLMLGSDLIRLGATE